jgi:hypothetical protein
MDGYHNAGPRKDPVKRSKKHFTLRATFAAFLHSICDSSVVSQNLILASTAALPPARPPAKIQAVGIVIPTRNHASAIGKCIAGLFAANSCAGWRSSLWIVVVAHGSTDDTARIARQALGAFSQVLAISAHSRAAAYEVGADAVMDHFRDVPRHAVLLIGGDPTAQLPRDWIDKQLKGSQFPLGLASNPHP